VILPGTVSSVEDWADALLHAYTIVVELTVVPDGVIVGCAYTAVSVWLVAVLEQVSVYVAPGDEGNVPDDGGSVLLVKSYVVGPPVVTSVALFELKHSHLIREGLEGSGVITAAVPFTTATTIEGE
jgi:hypothetical protein